MKTNVNALKDLFVKFGGSLSTVYEDISPDPVGEYVGISAMIEACAKVVGGGSGGMLLVNVEGDPDEGVTVDVAFNDIYSAFNNGSVVAFLLVDYGVLLQITSIGKEECEAQITAKSEGEFVNFTLSYSDSAWTLTFAEFIQLPSFTNADAGKVLSVNADGELAWTLPS